jgi:hypothetical protein
MKYNAVYLSGKISDNPNAFEQFEKVERQLEEKGFLVLNPMKFGLTQLKNESNEVFWDRCMRTCIVIMMRCNTIYMLNNDFESSRGAKIELQLATSLGFKILYEFKDLQNERV